MKLLRSLIFCPRCRFCRERTRHMEAHIWVNHTEVPE